MKGRRYRGRPASGMPRATPESQVKIGWLSDRLRRSTLAMEDALKIIDSLDREAPPDPDALLAALGQVAAVLRPAIEAEKRDAAR